MLVASLQDDNAQFNFEIKFMVVRAEIPQMAWKGRRRKAAPTG
jgi:hypothetical protein